MKQLSKQPGTDHYASNLTPKKSPQLIFPLLEKALEILYEYVKKQEKIKKERGNRPQRAQTNLQKSNTEDKENIDPNRTHLKKRAPNTRKEAALQPFGLIDVQMVTRRMRRDLGLSRKQLFEKRLKSDKKEQEIEIKMDAWSDEAFELHFKTRVKEIEVSLDLGENEGFKVGSVVNVQDLDRFLRGDLMKQIKKEKERFERLRAVDRHRALESVGRVRKTLERFIVKPYAYRMVSEEGRKARKSEKGDLNGSGVGEESEVRGALTRSQRRSLGKVLGCKNGNLGN